MTNKPVDLGVSPVIADGSTKHPTLRPRDASSLILIDRSKPVYRVLVGKRARAHAFMPDMYVFPGGRRDASDSRLPVAVPLRQEVLDRLTLRTPARFSHATARGLATAAARELEEEVSLSLNPGGQSGKFQPDLSKLRFVARAITPPGRTRRFDTRFFACFTDEIDADTDSPKVSNELIDLTWLPINDCEQVPLPLITNIILSDLHTALQTNPELPFSAPVPFYLTRGNRFLKDML